MLEVVKVAVAKKLLDTKKRLYFNLSLTNINSYIKDILTPDIIVMFNTYLSDSSQLTIKYILFAIRDRDFKLQQNVKL